MKRREAAIFEWISSQQESMMSLLATSVNTYSGSYDKVGVDAVGMLLSKFFADHGIKTTTLPLEGFGDTLLTAPVPSDGLNAR
ncbi:M20 family metallopeptidase [Mesorhizobium sp. CGMCC 1.15528]|uniref:M20 family metallopeptidase n=1 Tax=Mesorhizobium zhangyense TaxID=1776730 RepID=A0A7C9R9M5_9HYPH|nr:M20 family metallopeptidase [Mesorhizobium zhangyense]NGN43640.1 M20 family metallopeptidase [Mesorhizobium zhangyense]